MSNDYADLIINYPLTKGMSSIDAEDYCYRSINDDYSVVNIERSAAPPLSLSAYGYLGVPSLYGLMESMPNSFNPQALSSTGNIRVQNPPLSLQGRGVILGFIDTGIRYQLDVFRRPDGGSRIISIWDQAIQEGEPPEGFVYGTEYKRVEIDRALQSENPLAIVPSTDRIGHGTELASVAAGSILNEGVAFRGAAPQADIAVVKLKGAKQYLRDFYLVDDNAEAYQENDIMEAVRYLEQMAVDFSRPVVILLGVGTNLGSHLGTSPLASYLNVVAEKRSRAVVVCGGNEGDKEHHYTGSAPDMVEIRVSEPMKGFCLELWGELPDFYTITVRSPGGETSPEIDYRGGAEREISFVFERTKIFVEVFPVEFSSGEELLFLRFQNPTPGIWSIHVLPARGRREGRGIFHLWLPITAFLERDVNFLSPNPDMTLTEPANAKQVITISAYNSQGNSWFPESGRGFVRDGDVKPDMAAPGVRVSTILGERTGSSLAAAIAAGCAAQFMEWAVVERNAVYIGNKSLKSYLVHGAERFADIIYPDGRWGYGTIDINGTFETLART